jgi:hypothetical protein
MEGAPRRRSGIGMPMDVAAKTVIVLLEEIGLGHFPVEGSHEVPVLRPGLAQVRDGGR